MAVTSARGMKDFLPRDKEHRDSLLATIGDTYLRHGFEPMETPAMEERDRLHSGLGGDNEKLSFQVLKRGVSVEDLRQATSVDELSDLGLRFDLTVPLARFYASHHASLPPVFRSFHTGPVWRAERPQKGRYRQFVQCDIDILGEESSLAEVEILVATADVLDRLGVKGWSFRVNDRRLLTELLSAAGIAPEDHPSALITLDKLDKVGVEGVLAELSERLPKGWSTELVAAVLGGGAPGFEPSTIAGLMGNTEAAHHAAAELVAWVSQVVALLPEDSVVWDPTLVRGMGYYTSSIVEISHPELGGSLGGGGRYDGMIGRFLGKNVPAMGLSLGFERLLDVVPLAPLTHPNRVALVMEGEGSGVAAMVLKMHLVGSGHTVRVVAGSRNMRAVYDRLVADGFSKVAEVHGSAADVHRVEDLIWRELG